MLFYFSLQEAACRLHHGLCTWVNWHLALDGFSLGPSQICEEAICFISNSCKSAHGHLPGAKTTIKCHSSFILTLILWVCPYISDVFFFFASDRMQSLECMSSPKFKSSLTSLEGNSKSLRCAVQVKKQVSSVHQCLIFNLQWHNNQNHVTFDVSSAFCLQVSGKSRLTADKSRVFFK